MTNSNAPILVAGATGAVGGLVARKLLAAGIPVRALGRNVAKLAALKLAGADTVSVDLLDRAAVARACEGVDQVYSTVNNVMGRGTSSPNRVDVAAHQSLVAAARGARVKRCVYLSGGDMSADSPVDFFRTKHAIEEVVRASGVPYVVIQPSAFMEIWVAMMTDGIRKNGTIMLFGDGRMVSNYIAGEDVAEISARILMRPEIVNESIKLGGPSNISGEQLAALVEAQLGVKAKRRRIPTPVLWTGGLLLRPFNEVAARLMRMGYYTATRDGRFTDSAVVAERFGVSPMTIESFMANLT